MKQYILIKINLEIIIVINVKIEGLAKFSINEQKLILTRKCVETSGHNIITYDEFCEIFEKDKLSLIDFNIKKMKKFLITKLFENNKDNENINIKKEFSKITKIELKLNSNEISKIKTKIRGKYKGLSLLECIQKLKELNDEIEFISQDIKYNIKLKNNKTETREEKIIVIGIKKNLNLMNNTKFNDYFIDITFKLMPKKFRPNKLMTVATVDKDNNKTLIIAFVVFKYMDSESYYRIFKYLNENYSFSPKYIHTDYELALDLAIKKSDFFNKDIVHLKCFFHFAKSIREKLKKIDGNKKGLNKETSNILNNIELICFIDEEKVEGFKKFIIENLKRLNHYQDFINYLNSSWFKRKNTDYNFSNTIKKFSSNNEALNKIYFTNNIAESIHSKINYFLPRHISTEYNFINTLNNVLISNHINNSNIIRKDFKSRSLINLIKNESINQKFQWLDNSLFKQYLTNYINNELKDNEKDENENLIKYIEEDENILNNEDNKDELIIEYDSSSNDMDIDSKISENDSFNNVLEELIEEINVINIKEENNDGLKKDNEMFSVKSEVENNEIKFNSKKNDISSNILDNEDYKNHDKQSNSKININDDDSNLNNIYLQPLSIRIAKRNKKLSDIKSGLDVKKKSLIILNQKKEKNLIQIVKIILTRERKKY